MSALIAALALAAAQTAAASAAPALPPAAPAAHSAAAAEIRRLEQQWGEAFVNRDFAFIETIVAPEYRLVVAAPNGEHGLTPRAKWMANARLFTHHAFTVETVDVNLAGDTAVASARGVWTVSFRAGQPPHRIRFFVTDTWLRRGGRWRVIHRYSHRLGDASPPAPPPAASERG